MKFKLIFLIEIFCHTGLIKNIDAHFTESRAHGICAEQKNDAKLPNLLEDCNGCLNKA